MKSASASLSGAGLWGRQVAVAVLRVVEGMVVTSFAVVAASKHKRWSSMKSASASLSGVARSDASNVDVAATTMRASDPISQREHHFGLICFFNDPKHPGS